MNRLLPALCLSLVWGGLARGAPESGIVFERVLRARVEKNQQVVEQTSTRTTTWRLGTRERSEQAGNGFAQLGTSIRDLSSGEAWIVDDTTREVAPLSMEPGDSTRILASDFGLETDARGEIIGSWAFEPRGDREIILGVSASRYTLRTSSKRLRVEVWVAPGLPLRADDWASALRRRLGAKVLPSVETFLAAWAALPGYPVRVRTVGESSGATVTVDNELSYARREPIAAARVELPADYARRKSYDSMLVDRQLASARKEGVAALTAAGVAAPFTPSAARAVPSPLKGGSCRSSQGRWNTSLACYERVPGDLHESCFDTYASQPCPMPKAKRKKPHNPARAHDRRARDLLRNAEVATVESSTHRRRDGQRLDVIASTRHDTHALADYRQLRRHGITSVRDGVRWHLVEAVEGVFDWSSLDPMVEAARSAGTQVIWDLLHYGWPDWTNPIRCRFRRSFRGFCRSGGRAHRAGRDVHSDQ